MVYNKHKALCLTETIQTKLDTECAKLRVIVFQLLARGRD